MFDACNLADSLVSRPLRRTRRDNEKNYIFYHTVEAGPEEWPYAYAMSESQPVLAALFYTGNLGSDRAQLVALWLHSLGGDESSVRWRGHRYRPLPAPAPPLTIPSRPRIAGRAAGVAQGRRVRVGGAAGGVGGRGGRGLLGLPGRLVGGRRRRAVLLPRPGERPQVGLPGVRGGGLRVGSGKYQEREREFDRVWGWSFLLAWMCKDVAIVVNYLALNLLSEICLVFVMCVIHWVYLPQCVLLPRLPHGLFEPTFAHLDEVRSCSS